MPGPHADHLGERPEGDALAVGEAAAAVPPDVVLEAVHVLEVLPAEPRLADSGDADHGDELRAALVGGRVEELLHEPKLAVAPDEGRLEPGRLERAAAAGGHPQRAPERRRLGLALELVLAGVRVRDRGLEARFVDSPTRTVPGSAADWIREAVLTRSPATIPCPSAPRVTAASPVRTPARAWSAASSSGTAATRSSAARTARSASSSVRDRRAPDGHDGVADELLDRAAVALDERARGVEVAREELADVLGVATLGERGEADEVGEEDGDEAAFGCRRTLAGVWAVAAAASASPHSPQNFMAGAFGVPHEGQARESGRAALAAELLIRPVPLPTGRAHDGVRHCARIL